MITIYKHENGRVCLDTKRITHVRSVVKRNGEKAAVVRMDYGYEFWLTTPFEEVAHDMKMAQQHD